MNCRIALSLTYFLILFEGFGRDRIWNQCQAHTPYPPVALQSSKELLLGGAYPVAGGLSGNCDMNSLRATLRGSSAVMLLTLLGSVFHNWAASPPLQGHQFKFHESVPVLEIPAAQFLSGKDSLHIHQFLYVTHFDKIMVAFNCVVQFLYKYQQIYA